MRHYPAKLLLFGEHVLLLGASALAVPVSAFGGHWDQASAKADIRGLQMRLAELATSDLLRQIPGMDVEQLKNDLRLGLFFRSNIPTGYGLGSSGALCAAVYDRYCRTKTSDLPELKTIFAAMESFFHGTSSGIDPLTSYLNKPLLIRSKTEISIPEMSEWRESRPVVFLLDTQLPRQTGPMVQWFLEQNSDAVFAGKVASDLLPFHEKMVQAWLDAHANEFWSNLQFVSQFQLEHFGPMIPTTIKDFWQKNLDNEDIALKICGAGGGGFVLGFAKSKETTERLGPALGIVYPFEN